MTAKVRREESRSQQHENVVPLHPDAGGLEVELPRRLAHIPPGEYQAATVSVKRYTAFQRLVLQIDFDVFRGDIADGVRLARLPLFCRWNGKRPAPSSKLGKLLVTARLEGQKGRAIALSALTKKFFVVRVGDATSDSAGNALREPYSVIRDVVARLA